MSNQVKCYLLRAEPKILHEAIVITKGGGGGRCGDKPWHRAQIPVDESTTFEDVYSRLLPVKCMYCGRYEFTRANSDVALGHYEHVYVNPVTHIMSPHVRVAAAPGAMWYCDWLLDDDGGPASFLSAEYRRDWLGKRPPIAVMLPGGSEWVVDQCATGQKTGWTVTGEAPMLTASPSIDAPGYHGWLRDGVLTSV
jgi:hypothetical protein